MDSRINHRDERFNTKTLEFMTINTNGLDVSNNNNNLIFFGSPMCGLIGVPIKDEKDIFKDEELRNGMTSIAEQKDIISNETSSGNKNKTKKVRNISSEIFSKFYNIVENNKNLNKLYTPYTFGANPSQITEKNFIYSTSKYFGSFLCGFDFKLYKREDGMLKSSSPDTIRIILFANPNFGKSRQHYHAFKEPAFMWHILKVNGGNFDYMDEIELWNNYNFCLSYFFKTKFYKDATKVFIDKIKKSIEYLISKRRIPLSKKAVDEIVSKRKVMIYELLLEDLLVNKILTKDIRINAATTTNAGKDNTTDRSFTLQKALDVIGMNVTKNENPKEIEKFMNGGEKPKVIKSKKPTTRKTKKQPIE